MAKALSGRVVISGMGVIAPNAHGLVEFERALREGISGIRFIEKLKELNFSCQVGGIPQGIDEIKKKYFTEEALLAMNSSMIYAGIAGMDCWTDAGFETPKAGDQKIDWDTGAIIGTGIGGVDTVGDSIVPKVNEGKVKRLGSSMVEQAMASAVSAKVGGLLGLGGQVTTNSSACNTGTEAIVNAYFLIKHGYATRIMAGGAEGCSQYSWAGFDSMRVLAKGFNDQPERASRPMSASASGFVPSSGAGILMIESLESATARGARIYAEILGGLVNSGGQRGAGSMTAPNPEGVRRCIQGTIKQAGIAPAEIGLINGHLTATMADKLELANWQNALGCTPEQLPWINSTKSLIGHSLGAAGGIECVASVLELSKGFVHGSLNCEDLHPELTAYASRIPHKTQDSSARLLIKASFGFGDVNGCLLFRRWEA